MYINKRSVQACFRRNERATHTYLRSVYHRPREHQHRYRPARSTPPKTQIKYENSGIVGVLRIAQQRRGSDRALLGSAHDLVADDTNGVSDIFLRDVQLGTTELVSRGITGIGNGDSSSPTISTNGQFIAFESNASNLVPGDTNALPDVFLYDVAAKT